MGRVLVVEPYDEIRTLLATALRRQGHVVDTTDDPCEALVWLNEQPFDCAVLGSPIAVEIGGASMLLLDHIGRSHPDRCPSIIIITTQLHDEQLLALADRLEVCAVFAKPFLPTELERVVSICAAGGRPATRWFGIPQSIVEEALSGRGN
jgi:DNA-binding NtrC family response regulator